MLNKSITFSIISHEQGELVRHLLTDIRALLSDIADFEIILTLNTPEEASYDEFKDLPLHIVKNPQPKGFGANHNAAFKLARGEYFTIVNPDIRLCAPHNIEALLAVFTDSRVGAVAPMVLSACGREEDNARRFPTVLRLAARRLRLQRGLDYRWSSEPIAVDWVAGMFVVFRRAAFAAVHGFDERFFMYMEDADICRRLQGAGWSVWLTPGCSVVHEARRASRRNLKHLCWHLVSAFRYFIGL